jgi:GNAT superfamily N-acetyltransferase
MVTTGDGQDIELFDQSSPQAADLLREFHDEILLRSFPPEEYIPATTINPGDGLAVIARTSDGLVVGGALGEIYPACDSLLLGYLAVRPGLRRAGIGSRVLAAAQHQWLTRLPAMFLELDDPRHHGPHADYGDAAARLRFYGRFGVRLLVMPYFQPRLSSELPRAYHMFLAVLPREGAVLPDKMPAQHVGAFLREYFEVCEGSGTHADAEVRWLLDVARGPEIALVSIDEFDRVPDTSPPGRP